MHIFFSHEIRKTQTKVSKKLINISSVYKIVIYSSEFFFSLFSLLIAQEKGKKIRNYDKKTFFQKKKEYKMKENHYYYLRMYMCFFGLYACAFCVCVCVFSMCM